MKQTIEELWHGNIIPQEDSRTNTPEMKELLSYMARHHEDLEKSFTDELVDWIGKLVTAHIIEEALKITEDDSKPSQVGNESSFAIAKVGDEGNN